MKYYTLTFNSWSRPTSAKNYVVSKDRTTKLELDNNGIYVVNENDVMDLAEKYDIYAMTYIGLGNLETQIAK